MPRSMIFSFAALFLGLSCSDGARILGIFPSPLFSHHKPFQAIMKALAARGHQVTVISPYPLQIPMENYSDIDLSFSIDCMKSTVDYEAYLKMKPLDYAINFPRFAYKLVDAQLSSPQLQAFMKSNDTKFDLVVKQNLMFNAYDGLVHHLGSPPVVSISSLGGIIWNYYAFANPSTPSYCPATIMPYSDHMSFWERLHNWYVELWLLYIWHFDAIPTQEVLMRKYFGSNPPPIYESDFNNSLTLLGNHWSLGYPRPLLPNVVELTGLHLQTKTLPLPQDIRTFLDQAEYGVVYFSLGTNVVCSKIPEEKLQQINEAFSLLPQRVLWKCDQDNIAGKPENVKVVKWLPQQDVLAHPKVRVFINQGGLQSFQEAAYHGVPLIGIPFIADQRHNVHKFVASKIGVHLDFQDLTKHTLLEAIGKVLNDTSYRDNMKKFSAVYREHAELSFDKAIWWIEYVIRHNGAKHLRSAALDLTWYQYLLLDVIAAILLALIITSILCYFLLKKLIKFSLNYLNFKKLKQL